MISRWELRIRNKIISIKCLLARDHRGIVSSSLLLNLQFPIHCTGMISGSFFLLLTNTPPQPVFHSQSSISSCIHSVKYCQLRLEWPDIPIKMCQMCHTAACYQHATDRILQSSYWTCVLDWLQHLCYQGAKGWVMPVRLQMRGTGPLYERQAIHHDYTIGTLHCKARQLEQYSLVFIYQTAWFGMTTFQVEWQGRCRVDGGVSFIDCGVLLL